VLVRIVRSLAVLKQRVFRKKNVKNYFKENTIDEIHQVFVSVACHSLEKKHTS